MLDSMNPMDRDCIVAAILTTGMKGTQDSVGEGTVTERFSRVLKELQGKGGTAQMWSDATKANKR